MYRVGSGVGRKAGEFVVTHPRVFTAIVFSLLVFRAAVSWIFERKLLSNPHESLGTLDILQIAIIKFDSLRAYQNLSVFVLVRET